VANETISQLPTAITISGNDILEISQYTGAPGTGYTSKKISPLLLAGIAPVATITAVEFIAAGNTGYRLNTGLAGYLVAPYGGLIRSVTLLADTTGTIVINIWKCSNAQFDAGITHPVAGDTICGSTPPTITSGVKSLNTSLAGWTTAFSGGDVFAFYVDSTSGTISQITLSISVTKTTLP
jgi:hypothetical protein